MRQTKIVFIGAGNMSFGLTMLKDAFSNHDLSGSTLTLVDIGAEKLASMARLASLLNEKSGAGVKIEQTMDRRAALRGAEFVVSSVVIDRNRLWKLDFEIPKRHGIRQTLGENDGPGGLFFTLRTLPLIFEIVRGIGPDQLTKEARPYGRPDADTQTPDSAAARYSGSSHCVVELTQHLARLQEEASAGTGHAHAGMTALEQRYAEQILERAHAAADRRWNGSQARSLLAGSSGSPQRRAPGRSTQGLRPDSVTYAWPWEAP